MSGAGAAVAPGAGSPAAGGKVPVLVTERLLLRRWRPRDLAPFAALNADPEVMAHFPRVLGREESDGLVSRIEDRWREDGICFAVAERRSDGAFLGMLGLAVLRLPEAPPCVEVGWRLGRAHWRSGYATEAARAWVDFGFREMGLSEIVAITVPANAASRRVMLRLGMREQPERAFLHPGLPVGHRLRPHLLHALDRPGWEAGSRRLTPPGIGPA